MINVVNCEFKKGGKSYYFSVNNLDVSIGDNVIVNTEKGFQYATVISDQKKIDEKNVVKEIEKIQRIATKDDYNQYKKNISDSEKAFKKAVEISKRLGLEMKFTEVNYSFDRTQLIFYYTSDMRIDFRELAKELASIFKTRIELRQIGVRDKAKKVSGLGMCGRELCCASFLKDLDSVTITMAKNQALTLNPNKINGSCGRLLCCLNYEEFLYKENRNGMPDLGDKIETEFGVGTVFLIDIPNRRYLVNIPNHGKMEFFLNSKCDKCDKSDK